MQAEETLITSSKMSSLTRQLLRRQINTNHYEGKKKKLTRKMCVNLTELNSVMDMSIILLFLLYILVLSFLLLEKVQQAELIFHPNSPSVYAFVSLCHGRYVIDY